MAIATLTATTYNQNMRLNASGAENVIYGHLDFGNRTLSDIIWLGRIPNGAVITDWWLTGSSSSAAAIFKLGITGGGTESTFLAAGTLSTGGVVTKQMRVDKPIPFSVSMSDTDAQSGATVYMTLTSGTWSTSTSIDFMFKYMRAGNVTL